MIAAEVEDREQPCILRPGKGQSVDRIDKGALIEHSLKMRQGFGNHTMTASV